jgi:hypothetical protein
MTSSIDSSATVEVENLDMFVKLLTQWHETKVKVLEHMLQIPEGTEVEYAESESKPLSGDLHQGFIIGLTVALSELGILPFVTQSEATPAPDEATA